MGRTGKNGGAAASTIPGKKSKKKRHTKMKKSADEEVMKFAGVDNLSSGLFDLHCHSICSDGHLSPELVVDRAYRNGVRVMALTDHDTMAGVPDALRAARKYGMRVIPGIEISAKYVQRQDAVTKCLGCRQTGRGGAVTVREEPVHILAYYGCCGPSNCEQLEQKLLEVREGRYDRAKEMVRKLALLHKPVKWEDVLRIAGEGVAPGRPHVARALYEAGHVDSVGQAFTKYLHNNGPAYATGAELPTAEVVQLIKETGGVSVLAHPWTLKDPMPVIEHLVEAGINGMEVYRTDGRHAAFGPLGEVYKLVRVGGSDFHGSGDPDETDLGGIDLPSMAVREFLRVAEPLWSSAVEHILQHFAEGALEGVENDSDQTDAKSLDVWKGDISLSKISVPGEVEDVQCLRLSPWLSEVEKESVEMAASRLGLKTTTTDVEGHIALGVYKH
ncbi:hypothetical protein R1sor_021101 [Riccia sorocarpa]|uniref:Polymerase/histidinol phosphatase N-terminal domain-containing protein n=1 Tax=Riccia sorocarpa TaxID=122646 RepID=A0ABD3GJG5_9MARC